MVDGLLNLRRRTMRAVLALPRLLQDELARIRLVRHGDAYLTVGIAAGMLVSLWAVHTFGYRPLPSPAIPGTATTARRVLQSRGGASPTGGDLRAREQNSPPSNAGQLGGTGDRDAER